LTANTLYKLNLHDQLKKTYLCFAVSFMARHFVVGTVFFFFAKEALELPLPFTSRSVELEAKRGRISGEEIDAYLTRSKVWWS
jgi:hypothetical protein